MAGDEPKPTNSMYRHDIYHIFLDAFGTGGSTTQLDFSFIQLNPLPFFPLQRSQILGES